MLISCLVISTLIISGAYAYSQGFTVTSVSLSNILHPGDPVTNAQWLIQLSMNGGGQSLVGVLDDSVINYQGYTSAYPLQISGSTDPETAFYSVDNSNPSQIYKFSTQYQTGSVSIYGICPLCYLQSTTASSCSGSVISEWDLNLPSGWFGAQGSTTVGRLCVYSQQTGSAAHISATPNIQFATHLTLSANGRSENLDLNYNQQSATSSSGNIQANWVGSFVTGNAPPDGSQYIAVATSGGQSWIVKSATDYNNYYSSYNNAKTMIQASQLYYTNSPPSNCPSAPYKISGTDWNSYINSYMSCLQNTAQSQYSVSNQYADNLASGGVTIGGSSPQLSNYNGQTGFKISLNNYFVTIPVVLLRLSGSFIGVVIPLGKPQILSATSDCFRSGENGKISINVKNIGKAQGAFYASLKNCPGMDIKTPQNIAVEIGQTATIELQVSSTGANQEINQACQVSVTDYNGGGSDTSSVSMCMKKASECQPNSVVVQGNSICPCEQTDGVWLVASGDRCKYCENGVVSGGLTGGMKCAKSPAYECTTDTQCDKNSYCNLDIHACVVISGCSNLINNGDSKQKADIVFVGDGYANDADLKKDILKIVDYEGNSNGLMSVEPFKSNENKFNIWMVRGGDLPSENGYIDRKAALEIAAQCTTADYQVIVSKKSFRSYAYFAGDAYLSLNMLELRWGHLFLHEFGHSFGKLADEYVEPSKGDRSMQPNCAPDMSTAQKWWGGVPNTGYYNGCSYIENNIRPTQNSLMRDHYITSEYGEVNKANLLKVLNKYG